MSREHELMTELRDARRARAAALLEEEEAALVHADRRMARRKQEAIVEEILREIETGKSGRPILDRVDGRGGGRPRDDDDDDGPADAPEWTPADLERELFDAVMGSGLADDVAVWKDLGRVGCDDARILEVLRSIWPASYMALPGVGPWGKRTVGKTVHGGPTPAFWVGARKSTLWKLAPPQLSGLQLADRVRSLLKIPRAAEPPAEPEPEPVADGKPARKPRRKEAVPS